MKTILNYKRLLLCSTLSLTLSNAETHNRDDSTNNRDDSAIPDKDLVTETYTNKSGENVLTNFIKKHRSSILSQTQRSVSDETFYNNEIDKLFLDKNIHESDLISSNEDQPLKSKEAEIQHTTSIKNIYKNYNNSIKKINKEYDLYDDYGKLSSHKYNARKSIKENIIYEGILKTTSKSNLEISRKIIEHSPSKELQSKDRPEVYEEVTQDTDDSEMVGREIKSDGKKSNIIRFSDRYSEESALIDDDFHQSKYHYNKFKISDTKSTETTLSKHSDDSFTNITTIKANNFETTQISTSTTSRHFEIFEEIPNETTTHYNNPVRDISKKKRKRVGKKQLAYYSVTSPPLITTTLYTVIKTSVNKSGEEEEYIVVYYDDQTTSNKTGHHTKADTTTDEPNTIQLSTTRIEKRHKIKRPLPYYSLKPTPDKAVGPMPRISDVLRHVKSEKLKKILRKKIKSVTHEIPAATTLPPEVNTITTIQKIKHTRRPLPFYTVHRVTVAANTMEVDNNVTPRNNGNYSTTTKLNLRKNVGELIDYYDDISTTGINNSSEENFRKRKLPFYSGPITMVTEVMTVNITRHHTTVKVTKPTSEKLNTLFEIIVIDPSTARPFSRINNLTNRKKEKKKHVISNKEFKKASKIMHFLNSLLRFVNQQEAPVIKPDNSFAQMNNLQELNMYYNSLARNNPEQTSVNQRKSTPSAPAPTCPPASKSVSPTFSDKVREIVHKLRELYFETRNRIRVSMGKPRKGPWYNPSLLWGEPDSTPTTKSSTESINVETT